MWEERSAVYLRFLNIIVSDFCVSGSPLKEPLKAPFISGAHRHLSSVPGSITGKGLGMQEL